MNFTLPNKIDENRILKYLGVEKAGENISSLIERAKKDVLSTASGLVCHKVYDVINDDILTGDDIKKHLDGCFGYVIFSVTLSAAVDKLIKKLSITDKAYAIVVDAVSSVACEQLEEEFSQSLKEEFQKKNLYLTRSYAPGYGDYPLYMVDRFIEDLNASKLIGVTVTPQHFMIPSKSITAIMGISKKQTEGFLAGCEHCKLYADCKIRKGGKTCVR
ncbi:MAG: hypothetical protein ACI4M6_06335 [Christensenellaceae bacterium]